MKPSPVFFPDGFLLADKPMDWTSHDVCQFVKKRFHIEKIGHAGTLDPIATGLLVLLIGKATKKSAELSAHDKDYAGVIRLGTKTDSQDRSGRVLETRNPAGITLEAVREKARAFLGEILQVPPMVSALKHKGVRLYKLARQGLEVEREPRPVTVFNFDLLSMEGPLIHFFSRVSKGTYVRTLAHDLGEALGCCACLEELRRVRSGQFSAEGSVTIDTLRLMEPGELRQKIIPLYPSPIHARSE